MEQRNPAYGNWTEEQTNWNDKDDEFIKDVIDEPTIPTTKKEILNMCRSNSLS